MQTHSSNSLPHGYGINKVAPTEKVKMEIYKDREKQNEEKKESLYKKKAFLEYLRECQKKALLDEENQKAEKKRPIIR